MREIKDEERSASTAIAARNGQSLVFPRLKQFGRTRTW